MAYRDDEQMIEGLYWEFDKQRSEKTRTERDIFKGKLRWALANAPSRGNDFAAIAQALNWERTEYDTLDELLAVIREQEQHHSDFIDVAIRDEEHMCKVRELLCQLAETLGSTPLLDEAIKLLEPRRYGAEPAPTTHTLLHAGELYREVTILLRTEQLVAWRTADGQEYSSPAHQVLLDPDEDGLAAAILSRIAGVEIAPEHMAELRAQMAGGVK